MNKQLMILRCNTNKIVLLQNKHQCVFRCNNQIFEHSKTFVLEFTLHLFIDTQDYNNIQKPKTKSQVQAQRPKSQSQGFWT